MNKAEAIKAMQEGHKLTHMYFSDGEYVTMKDGQMELTGGVKCSPEEFWKHRDADYWEDNWSLLPVQDATDLQENAKEYYSTLNTPEAKIPFIKKMLDKQGVGSCMCITVKNQKDLDNDDSLEIEMAGFGYADEICEGLATLMTRDEKMERVIMGAAQRFLRKTGK